jgi:hypothetical protein
LGCDATSPGRFLLMFWRNVPPSSSTTKMEAAHSSETQVNFYCPTFQKTLTFNWDVLWASVWDWCALGRPQIQHVDLHYWSATTATEKCSKYSISDSHK